MSSKQESYKSDPISQEVRVAIWYVLEDTFGTVQYDQLATPYWPDEIEILEERLRKRFRLLALADSGYPPELVKKFVIERANLPQLVTVAEEAVALWSEGTMHLENVTGLRESFERVFREGGVDVHFDKSGKLVSSTEKIDVAPKALADLPKQPEFKSDLEASVQKQIALVFIDLDSFKAVNDTNGHQAGDACLAKVAEVIGSVIAVKGKLYRYGGDEFAVILQNADVDEAAATGERIRRAIQIAKPGGEIEVTASLGVASSDQVGLDNAEKLLGAADRATYESKDGGKNRVTKWEGGAQTEPDDRTTPAERIKKLVDLAEIGVHRIQNNPKKDTADRLAEMSDRWEQEVLGALKDSGALQSEQSSIRVLGTYTSANLPSETAHHRKVINEVAEKIRRLRAIIERLEERQRRR